MNFQQLGLVHLVLPRARIIHCRRNAADTCLSIYFTHFRALQSLACNRSSIATYYRDFHRLMDHWRSVMPKDVLLEVEYEDLVANQEWVTRQIIDFCGLDWDPSCLRPNANDRIIGTASM